MIEVDGSEKSGSGTIVRYSVGLASLLGKPLHLINIRKKRGQPGLRPQHLKAIQACAEMTNGRLKGDEVSSSEIFYEPGSNIKGGEFHFDIGTAGSTTMLAQTILPLAAFAEIPSKFEIIGGLFQDFAPAANHLEHVVFPLYRKIGLDVHVEVKRPGYVPRGEGILILRTKPVKKLTSLSLPDQGKIKSIKGIALASHLKEKRVAQRMAEACNETLKKFDLSAHIQCIEDTSSFQTGASLFIYLETTTGCLLGSDFPGKYGRTSETIGKKVAKMLMEDFQKKATVDRHTADQLILYAALAHNTTHYLIPEMNPHIESNLCLIEKILKARSQLSGQSLKIMGIGFQK